MPREDYEERKQARIERYEARAEKARQAKQAAWEVVENVAENRLQIVFPGKPSEETRRALKRNGFRWAPSAGAWQRQLNNAARHAAEYVLANVGERG